VRVGIVDALTLPEWAEFWERFLDELGVETLRPGATAERPAPALDFAPCLAVARLADAVARLKRDADRVIVPRLADLHEAAGPVRGASLDCPWLVDLDATMSAMLPGLPAIHVLPARLDAAAGVAAAALAQALGKSGAQTRRALGRVEPAIARARRADIPPGAIAVLGQPYLLADSALRAALAAAATRPLFYQDQLTGETLSAELARQESPSPLSTDRELAGAMAYFDRHPGIAGILAIVSVNCPPIPRLVDRLFTGARKPVQVALIDQAAAVTSPLHKLEARIDQRR
jgi:hypothetical protein